ARSGVMPEDVARSARGWNLTTWIRSRVEGRRPRIACGCAVGRITSMPPSAPSAASSCQLGYSVKTGIPAFDHVFNVPIFEHLSRNPEVAAVFDNAMTSISAMEARATSDAYDFKGVETLMDVAGGHGLLLATVLRRHKTMHGVLFDLPHVAAGAAATFTRLGITGRVRVESGDFFKELPSGADAIIMQHLVHAWDD